MRRQLTGGQSMIAQAIRDEMASGKSLKEAVNSVMRSREFNHMTVKSVVQKLEAESRHYRVTDLRG